MTNRKGIPHFVCWGALFSSSNFSCVQYGLLVSKGRCRYIQRAVQIYLEGGLAAFTGRCRFVRRAVWIQVLFVGCRYDMFYCVRNPNYVSVH